MQISNIHESIIVMKSTDTQKTLQRQINATVNRLLRLCDNSPFYNSLRHIELEVSIKHGLRTTEWV